MSHYTLLVMFHPQEPFSEKRLQLKLTPFDENRSVSPYQRPCYCNGLRAKNEANIQADALLGKTFEEWRAEYASLENKPSWKAFIAPYIAKIDQCEKKHPLYQKPDPACSECRGSGETTSTYNPNAKWDWYEVGGRWRGMFLTKSGTHVDISRIRDIDFDEMSKRSLEKAEQWWEESKKEDVTSLYFRYGIEESDTKERYLQKQSAFSCFSVLTPDGVWHERGKMGWFAHVHSETESEETWNATFYERFIKHAHPDTTLVLVDCHI